jgi:hypothetical protein
VITDEQEAPVGGQIFQPVDVDAGQVHGGGQSVGNGEDRFP